MVLIKKRVLVIVNPISGRKSKCNVIGKIISHLDLQKHEVTIRFTSYPGHATELSAYAVKHGVDIVVVVGGDGTVNEVAQSLVNTHTVLGIIPSGSGNGLARHLHIPMNVRRAIEVINHGKTETIDTMKVNGKYCFCTLGVGYDALVSAEYAKESNRGLWTYIRKGINGWFKYKPQEYSIQIDNHTIKRKAFVITCANANQWGNEFHVAPKASLQDGLIDLTIINPIHFKNSLSMPFQILGYSFDQNPDVECFKCSTILINRPGVNLMHIDGEPCMFEEEIKVEIVQSSLQVLAGDYFE